MTEHGRTPVSWRDLPEWNTDLLVPVCQRIIRKHLARELALLSASDRTEFVEDEALSLAYALVVVASERCDELHADLLRAYRGRAA